MRTTRTYADLLGRVSGSPALAFCVRLALASVVATASLAWGQTGAPSGSGAITVEVGDQAEAWVADANGWFCDDPSLLRAIIVTERDLNHWVVEGVKPGRTTCRVGTDLGRASYVFAITVTEPTPKP